MAEYKCRSCESQFFEEDLVPCCPACAGVDLVCVPHTESPDDSPGNEDGHYSGSLQPIDYIETLGLSYHEGNVVKYVTRWRKKGGVEDLKKAVWYLERMIAKENT